ncbi:MAG: hypothetical protein ACERKZ_15010 [Lachnotalea sp.]
MVTTVSLKLELCFKYHVFLIEDDYLADLNSDKRILPLHYYNTNDITFYIRSFSKSFIPGIRLGAIVMPTTFINSMTKQKYLLDISTSSISQGALDYFIKSGMYNQHIKKVATCYKRGNATLIAEKIILQTYSYLCPMIPIMQLPML